jgi:hypothetical protein
MNGSTWLAVGLAAGASVALLFLTARFKALRATVRARSYIDLQKLHTEWRARMAQSPRFSTPFKGGG